MPQNKRKSILEWVISLRDLLTWGIPAIIAIITATHWFTINVFPGPEDGPVIDDTIPPTPDSTLILIGSGTIVRFLKSNLPELDTVKNPLVFSGPSLSAVQLLLHKEHDGPPNFGCIALSATHIRKDSLMNEAGWAGFQRGNKNKRVVALKIGEDTLTIGLLKPNSLPFFRLEDTIQDSIVYRLVMQCDTSLYSVYSTSEMSGTLTEFRNLFKQVDPSFEKIPGYISCFDASPWTIHEIMKRKKPALFLCSVIYSTDAMDLRYIRNATGNILKKTLYLYFIVRDLDFRNENYLLTGATARFLIKLKNKLTGSAISGNAITIPIPVPLEDAIIETDINHL